MQCSSTSHTSPPLAARQTTLGGANVLGGHVPLAPVQDSPTSHGPAGGRQDAPAERSVQFAAQQDDAVPVSGPSSHCSAYDGPASTTPLPHSETSVTVTKCPSSLWVRGGTPG